VKHYTTDIIADEMQMIGGGDRDTGNGTPRNNAPRPQRRDESAKFDDDFGDDPIPF